MNSRNMTKIPWKIVNEYVFQFQNRIHRNEKTKKLLLLQSNSVLLKQTQIFGPFLTKRRIRKTFFSNSIQFQNRYKSQNFTLSQTVLTYTTYLFYKTRIQQSSFVNFFIKQKEKNIHLKNEPVNCMSDIPISFFELQNKQTFLHKTFSSSWLLQLKAIQFIFHQSELGYKKKNFKKIFYHTIYRTSKVQKLGFIKRQILSPKTLKNSAFIRQNLKKNKNVLRKKIKHSLFSLVFEPQFETKMDRYNYRKNSGANFYDAIESVFELCQTKFWFCFFFQGNFLSNEKVLLFHYLKKLFAGVLLHTAKGFIIKNEIHHYPQKYRNKDFYYNSKPSHLKKMTWSKVKIPLLWIKNKKQLVLFYKIILFCGFSLPFFQKKIEFPKLTFSKIFDFCAVSLTNLQKKNHVEKNLVDLLFNNLYLKELASLTNYYYYFTFVLFTSCFFRFFSMDRIHSKNNTITKFNLLNLNFIMIKISFTKLLIRKLLDKNLSKFTNINSPQFFVSKMNLIECVSLIKNQKLIQPTYSFFTLLSLTILSAHLTTKLVTFSLKKQSFFFDPFVSKKKINPIQIIKYENQFFSFSSYEKLYFQNLFCLKQIEQKLTTMKKIVKPMNINFEKNLTSSRVEDFLLVKKFRLNDNFCSNYLFNDQTSSANLKKKTQLHCLNFEIRIFKNKSPLFTGLKYYLIPSKKQILIHLQEISYVIKTSKTKSQEDLISKLAPKIVQWSRYYKNVSTKKIFNYCDYLTLKLLWKWACRKHPKKNRQWIKFKYFVSLNARNWVFAIYQKTYFFYFCLPYHIDVHLVKHRKILNRKLPYDSDIKYWSKYFLN